MKIFISWSGDRSKALAEVLYQWLPAVIQAVKPYYSPDDIAKGTRWGVEIAKELEASRVGLICLTPDNPTAPWIMFEAGALSKSLDQSRLCPILFDLDPSDIQGPLVQFQACRFGREEMDRVVRMINGELGDQALAPDVLASVFDMWWPQLQERVAEVLATQDSAPPVSRSEREILEELLELMRLGDSPQYIVDRLDRLEASLDRLTDTLGIAATSDLPIPGYDPARAQIHRVRFAGAREKWPNAREALYATGRISMIEMEHSDGIFDVTLTTRGPLNRRALYRLLTAAGFAILPRAIEVST